MRIAVQQQDAASCGENKQHADQRFLNLWPALLGPMQSQSGQKSRADSTKLNFEATDDTDRRRPARSPGARLSTKEKEKILSDPAIQTLLTGLNATDPQVEKIRED